MYVSAAEALKTLRCRGRCAAAVPVAASKRARQHRYELVFFNCGKGAAALVETGEDGNEQRT
jgi:hypothetical protein